MNFLMDSTKAARQFDSLRESTADKVDSNDRVSSLKANNPDLIGWITIPKTNIDYPVMHTPLNPEFYLHRDFEKNSSDWGTPFLAGPCFLGCGNLIIYGHHMSDGSMFAQLTKFESKSFCDENSNIILETEGKKSVFSIWAVCLTDIEDKTFPYYNYTDLRDESLKRVYLDMVRQKALFIRELDPEGRELLTLSTCNYHTQGGRLVVVALQQ